MWLKPGPGPVLAAGLVAAALGLSRPASARVFATQEEALGRVFIAGKPVERRTAFLTEAQAERIREATGSEPDSRVLTFYVGTRPDGRPATAYFDTHRVRTLPETLMVLVDPEGRVVRVDMLSFLEPPDYLPRDKWFGQFEGRSAADPLSLKRDIHGITGATLSARAVTGAVRRILAIDAVLREGGPAPVDPGSGEGKE